MPQQQQQGVPPQPKKDEKEDEIMGICDSEDCFFESLDDNKNNINGNYCFLDDGYSEEKPTNKPNNSGTGEKTGRFDNNAYEAMMKSRGGP